MEHRALPLLGKDVFGEEHQAPLYYALAALPASVVDFNDRTGGFRWNRDFSWEADGEPNIAIASQGRALGLRGHGLALRILRVVSLLMGLGTVTLTVAMSSVLSRRSDWPGHVAGALVALNPQFLFISGAANNDNLLTLCWTACLVQLLRILTRPQPPDSWSWAWVGVWLSAALLAKTSAVTLLPLVALGIVFRLAADHDRPALLRAGAIVATTSTILCGWWFLRNLLLYGDPTGFGPFREAFGPITPYRWVDLPGVLFTQFTSFWGTFGWMTVPAPSWFHIGTGIITVVAGATVLKLFLSRRFLEFDSRRRLGFLLLGAAALSQEVFQLAAMQSFGESWEQGRYLFAAFPTAAVLVGCSASETFSLQTLRAGHLLLTAFLTLAAVYLLLGVITPAYAL